MKNLVQLARHDDLDTRTMLNEIINEPGDYLKCVVYVKKTVNGQTINEIWSTSKDKPFLWEASHSIANLSLKEIVDE